MSERPMIRGARKIVKTISTDGRLAEHPDVKRYIANIRDAYAIMVLRTYVEKDEAGGRCVTVWAVVKDKVQVR